MVKTTAKVNFRPLGDRVLVKPEEAKDKKSPGGIIIPDTAKEKPEHGIVVAVGMGKRSENNTLIPMSVKVGDRVMFSKYGYDEVKINDEEYYVVSESNILAVIK
ncbi:MAG TPA: co-chaperone GroES [Candidatus Paceibacterota bacterium]